MRVSDLSSPKTQKTLKEIAALVGGQVAGDEAAVITGACGAKEAAPGDITYIAGPKNLSLLKDTRASAVIVSKDVDWREKPVIRCDNPSAAFLKVLSLWTQERVVAPGVHKGAHVSASAKLGAGVSVGPGAVIEDDCVIGDHTEVLANAFVGRGTRIGSHCVLYQSVVVRENTRIDDRVILHCGAVIGADGFGYEMIEGRPVKVPQLGNVWIQENVEIGANACVDRARFGTTTIKKGTKIDNLVQVAHNVTIGENCLIVSQVGISGSTEIGDRVILAGQVGVVGHLKIGDGAIIGAQSGVYTSVEKDAVLLGSPPRPIREEKELIIYVSKLPQLFKDVKELKKKLEERGGASA